MLANSMVVPTIPVTDLEKAVPFYRDVLGLTVLEETPFSVRFGAGEGSQLSVYKRGPVERGHTMAHFEVADIDASRGRDPVAWRGLRGVQRRTADDDQRHRADWPCAQRVDQGSRGQRHRSPPGRDPRPLAPLE